MTGTVSNLSEFQAALGKAEPGSTIDLAPGHWPMLAARRRQVEGLPITIRALERRKTTIESADLQYWAGFKFEGLRWAKPSGVLFSMTYAADMGFADCEFTTAGPAGDVWDPWATDVRATSVRDAKRISFDNCDFWGLRQALVIRGSEDVTFSKCRLHHIREGIQVEGSSRVAIEDNEIGEIWPRFHMRATEHADAIQFYTRNETRGNEDVWIRRNRILLPGKRAVQAIFIRAENYENGRFPDGNHKRIEISENLIYNSAKWAIHAQSVADVKIFGNIVLRNQHVMSGWQSKQDEGRTSQAGFPCIMTRGDTTGLVYDNFAPAFFHATGVRQWNNRTGWPV